MSAPAAAPDPVVFLLDVDNTLLDNDQIIDDLRGHLTREVGADCQERYWAILEELRDQLGYVDYLGALQRYRLERPRDVGVLQVASFLLQYPFAERLYPRALAVVEYLGRWGKTVIVTDGDVVFQPWKVERSGLRGAVGGRVLIYVHKERELDDVERRYPARRYVFVDDKVRLLTAFKEVWGERVTTVFPRQGHYAHDPAVASYPRPDLTVERIADLLALDAQRLGVGARGDER
jgi:FMN phosphatase YigB (HAD superfamily)